MRVYKRTPKSRKWEVDFRDSQNITRRLTLFTDKTASEEAGRKIDKLVALRMAGENPDVTLGKLSCSDHYPAGRMGDCRFLPGSKHQGN